MHTKDPDAFRRFKEFRNHVTKELRASKRQYYINIFDAAAKSSKDTWKIMNSLLGRSTQPVTKIVRGNCELTETNLANAFNNYFLSLAPVSENTDYDFSYMKPHQQNTMFIEPVSPGEVISAFTSLKNSKAEDNLGLQVKPIKHVIDIISPILVHIFNICLSDGIFPRNMQCAKVTVVF